jgi:O-6-methylguanine DNA methyltransferase
MPASSERLALASRVDRVRVEPTRYAVPDWGVGDVWMQRGVLLAHEFHYAAAPKGVHTPPTGTVPGSRSRVAGVSVPIPHEDPLAALSEAAELVGRFRRFLAGEPVAFDDVELDLNWATPFQSALTAVLREIPRGEVVTYGELAALAGRPVAARAAGTFCATNRFALVVPCHRVVAADGIGGYGPDGVPIKRRLLELEGVRL